MVVGLVVLGRGHELRVGQHADAAQAGHAARMHADAGASRVMTLRRGALSSALPPSSRNPASTASMLLPW